MGIVSPGKAERRLSLLHRLQLGGQEWKMREKVWEKVTEPNLSLHLPPGEGLGMFLLEAKIS